MKIMLKKCIALIAAIFMMSASFAVVAAEEETAPVDKAALTQAQIDKYNKDLKFLTDVGIWTSPQTDPVLEVTRGEFASVIAGLCNLEVTNIPLRYSDVNEETQFYEDIYAVGIANIMVGSDGIFRPDDTITYNQAAKAIVCALGYEAIANARGGYPDGYYSAALELGLTVGRGRDEAMTRRDVVELAIKACEVDVMEVVGVSDEKVHFQISEDKNSLAIYHGIYELKGRFTDDGLTNLKGATQVPGNNVIIDGIKLKNNGVITDGLMGHNVIAYYRSSDETLLYVISDESKNSILTVKAEELVTDSTKFTKTNVVYQPGKSAEDISVSPYADFIYNGSSYPAFLVNDLKIKSGTLTFIDNNFDNIYDVVIAEEFVNYILQTNNQENELVSDRNSNEIHYGEYEKYEFFNTAGETKAISLLKDSSVLSVFASKDKVRIKIIVSEDKVEGKVTTLETTNDGDELVFVTYSVEGVETSSGYEYSATYLDRIAEKVNGYKKPVLNSEVTLRLDYQGKIAGLEAYNDQYQYAYFLAAGKDEKSKLSEKCLVKLCLNTGDIATVATAKKVIINGTSTENTSDILGITDLYVDGNTNGEFLRQLVKVKLNALGELKEIDTTNETENCKNSFGFDLTKFCLVYETTSDYSEYYNNKRQSYHGVYNMDETSTIFLVPPQDDFDERYIRVVEPTQLYDLARRAKVKMYDANELWTAKGVVVEQTMGQGFLPKALTVIKSVKGINADGDDIYMVTGRYKDEEYTFREDRPGIIDAAVPGGLKFGDIAAIKVDENFNIIDVKLRVRTSEDNPFQEVTGSVDTGEGVFYGHVYAKSDKVITLSTDRGASVRAHSIATGPQPVIIDYINHEVRQGKYTDVPVSASIDANGKFTYTDNGVTMYIYRYSGYINDAVVVIK